MNSMKKGGERLRRGTVVKLKGIETKWQPNTMCDPYVHPDVNKPTVRCFWQNLGNLNMDWVAEDMKESLIFKFDNGSVVVLKGKPLFVRDTYGNIYGWTNTDEQQLL